MDPANQMWLVEKQSQKYNNDKAVNEKGKHNRSLKVTVQGSDYYGPPVIHSFNDDVLKSRL
jgi:hypothetical protein